MSWFPEPATVRAEVLHELPARFRERRRSAWADFNRNGEAIDSFLEGPAFDRAGNLWLVDIPHGRIFRVTPDGDWTLVASYEGWPNGLAIAKDGRVLIADYKLGLLALDPAGGAPAALVPHVRSESFKGLNDLAVGADGAIYVTDQGQTGMQDPTGRVYRVTADGRLERLLDTCPSPNGIALSADGRHLFVALTRACQVWRTAIGRDAVLGKVNVFCHTPGGISGPDGLAATAEGGLVLANPGHGCAWLLDPYGVPTHRIVSPRGRSLTNVAFDPADPSRLVMTESVSGSVLVARLPVRGAPLPSHA
jgi:gluconolactonase